MNNLKLKRKQIDSKVLKDWKIKMYDTTYHEIADKTGLHFQTVATAIREGKASQTTITKLVKYFSEFKITA